MTRILLAIHSNYSKSVKNCLSGFSLWLLTRDSMSQPGYYCSEYLVRRTVFLNQFLTWKFCVEIFKIDKELFDIFFHVISLRNYQRLKVGFIACFLTKKNVTMNNRLVISLLAVNGIFPFHPLRSCQWLLYNLIPRHSKPLQLR